MSIKMVYCVKAGMKTGCRSWKHGQIKDQISWQAKLLQKYKIKIRNIKFMHIFETT
jgi:hypothetical protein